MGVRRKATANDKERLSLRTVQLAAMLAELTQAAETGHIWLAAMSARRIIQVLDVYLLAGLTLDE